MKNATTTKKEYEYYRLAKEAIDRGEAENALFNIRKALERVVKVLCGQCNIDTYKVDLCDLIQKIREANMIDEKEETLLHRIRIKSNCGVHAQEETEREATIDDGITKLLMPVMLLQCTLLAICMITVKAWNKTIPRLLNGTIRLLLQVIVMQ